MLCFVIKSTTTYCGVKQKSGPKNHFFPCSALLQKLGIAWVIVSPQPLRGYGAYQHNNPQCNPIRVDGNFFGFPG